MKKTLILLTFVGVFSSPLVALQESWMSMGCVGFVSYDVAPNSLWPAEPYEGGLGVSMLSYGFWDNANVGLFFYYAGLFPIDVKPQDKLYFYKSGAMDLALGPGFRFPLSDNLTVLCGAGLGTLFKAASYRGPGNVETQAMLWDLGIGGDIGLKFDLTSALMLNLGVDLSFYFVNNTQVDTENSSLGQWALNALFAVKPYIAIGFNMYNEVSHMGKPKN